MCVPPAGQMRVFTTRANNEDVNTLFAVTGSQLFPAVSAVSFQITFDITNDCLKKMKKKWALSFEICIILVSCKYLRTLPPSSLLQICLYQLMRTRPFPASIVEPLSCSRVRRSCREPLWAAAHPPFLSPRFVSEGSHRFFADTRDGA